MKLFVGLDVSAAVCVTSEYGRSQRSGAESEPVWRDGWNDLDGQYRGAWTGLSQTEG